MNKFMRFEPEITCEVMISRYSSQLELDYLQNIDTLNRLSQIWFLSAYRTGVNINGTTCSKSQSRSEIAD